MTEGSPVPSPRGVLTGYRVIDCTIAMAGPFAAQRLGDLGADVIKVEPTGGEWQRFASAGGANGNRINVSFLSLNRNKRSLAIDLKSGDGQTVLEGSRRDRPTCSCRITAPALLPDSGSTTNRCEPSTPTIVYVSISGYGEDGPYQDRSGTGPPAPGDVRRDAVGRAHGASLRRPPGSTSQTRSRRPPLSRGCSPPCCTASAPVKGSSSPSTCSMPSPHFRCRSYRSSPSAGSRRSAASSRTPTSTSAPPTASSPPATATSRWASRTWRRLAPSLASRASPGWFPKSTAGPAATSCTPRPRRGCVTNTTPYWLERLLAAGHLGRPGLQLPGPGG